MLAYALENPLKGFKKLQALMSSGYSMKENLFALCAFARMLLFVWNDRLQEGAGKEQDRAGIFDKLKEQEQGYAQRLRAYDDAHFSTCCYTP